MEVNHNYIYYIFIIEIRYSLGNFGIIPYGKTLLGKVYYIPQKDGTNYWCDSNLITENNDLYLSESNEYVPVYFVDHSIGCSYANKAINVQNANGKVMLLASDSNIIEEEYNIDDFIEKPAIPSIIITKDFGDIIREYYKYTNNDNNNENGNQKNIILNMKFSGVKQNGKVEIDLFFRSDDKKVLNFFIEFSYYRRILRDKLIITPHYKYSKYVNEQTSNNISDISGIPCVKESHMCATSNSKYNIKNPRTILLENIRQSCIYQELGKDSYYNYMMRFGELCLNPEKPDFTSECSNSSMNLHSIMNSQRIKECMQDMIDKKGKIEEDFYMFQKKKIYTTPDMYINGVPYRGSWYSKYIFETICSGFLDDKACKSINPNDIIENRTVNVRLIIILIVIIFCVLILSLKFYKMYIDNELEENYKAKIEEYTMNSISQYKPFSFNAPKSSKLEIS